MLLILLSLVSAAACYVTFAWWLPSDRERYQDYRAAEQCSLREMRQDRTDCLSTWQLTVVKTTVDKPAGKGHVDEATLTYRTSWRGTVSFGGPGPLLKRLKPGDQVTATAWRGAIVVLGKDGVRQSTTAAPRGKIQMNAAAGVLAALLAAQAFVFGAARLTRPRDYAPFTWDPYGKQVFFTITAISVGVGLTAAQIGIPWWTVPASVVPAAVCATAMIHHHLRRNAAASASGVSRTR
ncbi:hypothetical protein AB0M29_15450 [Streptomyces sp. NPDC051976]|uniref:hypothetical protein n=1 Tax=Streptomyces sp. NPDC051976 TaxID=3154947 RepID=UPI003422FF93